MDICLNCGDKGTTNAFVYCVNCLDCALHRYCMDVVTFDEFVPWVCDDCEVILQKQSAPQNCDPVTCNKGDHAVSKDIKVLSGEELKKCDTLAQMEGHVCEGDPTRQSSETHTKIGLDEFAKSASGSTHPIAEKDQHGSGKQRDQKRCSRQSCESESELGVGEHTCLVRKTPFKNSKKMKTAVFSEANSVEHGRNSDYADMSIGMTEIYSVNPNISNSYEAAPQGLPNVLSMLDFHGPALPVFTPIWRGSFNIQNKDNGMLDEFVAHMSSKACQKVFDEASQFQGVLHLEMLPRSLVWPKSFETSQPKDDSIALYFFPSDSRYERIFDHLVEEMVSQELAMKAILSNAELLVFTSLELPSQYWRFQGKYYLWGVFRGKQVSSHVVDDHLTDSTRGDKQILYSDCSKDMDVSGDKNTLKTKNWDARSPLSPLSNSD